MDPLFQSLLSFPICVSPSFLKRPPEKTLLPAWSLPVVLRALAEAPFEPLHKISLHCLAIKTAFLGGHRVRSKGQCASRLVY